MVEYHKCSKCGYISYGSKGFNEMMKHTEKCKRTTKNSDGIICLFTTFKRGGGDV